MAKFRLNQNVVYAGSNPVLRSFFKTGTPVLDIVPNNIPLGNGEINRSGQDIYKVEHRNTGSVFIFLENELAPAN